MILNNTVTFEYKKEDKTYSFTCRNDAPLGECYDALQEFTAYVVQRIQEETAKQECKEETCPIQES